MYTYTISKNLSEIFNCEFVETPELSDQALGFIPDDVGFCGKSKFVLGMRWITDGEINQYIESDSKIPQGWRLGRTIDHAARKDSEKWKTVCRRQANAQWSNPELRRKTSEAMRKPKKQQVCPKCNLVGAGGNMKRYHFDNCKR